MTADVIDTAKVVVRRGEIVVEGNGSHPEPPPAIPVSESQGSQGNAGEDYPWPEVMGRRIAKFQCYTSSDIRTRQATGEVVFTLVVPKDHWSEGMEMRHWFGYMLEAEFRLAPIQDLEDDDAEG